MRVYTYTNNKFNRTILFSHLDCNMILPLSISGLSPIKSISPIRRVFAQHTKQLSPTSKDKYEPLIVFIAT